LKLKLKDRKKNRQLLNIIEKDVYSQEEMDYMYAIVRDYLYEHQGENAIQVSENTNVPRNVIMTFLRQGKISLAENARHLLHPCKLCGAMIEYGEICHECKVSKMSKILYPDSPSVKKKMSGYDAGKLKQNQELGYGRRIRKSK
jgi:flagellar protein